MEDGLGGALVKLGQCPGSQSWRFSGVSYPLTYSSVNQRIVCEGSMSVESDPLWGVPTDFTGNPMCGQRWDQPWKFDIYRLIGVKNSLPRSFF